MSSFTLVYRPIPDDAALARIGAVAADARARITWETSARFGTACALIEEAGDAVADAIADVNDVRIYAQAVIALAIVPHVAQALPQLRAALCGAGRPTCVCDSFDDPGAAIVVFDASGWETIVALIDLELARCASSRELFLLSPMSLAVSTTIAASGLRADITPSRVLEAHFE